MDRKLCNSGHETGFWQSLFLLLIRVYWGFLFFIGGVYKVIHMAAFIVFLQQLGVYGFVSYFIAVFEVVCGVLIFFGLLTRWAAFVTSVMMLLAYIIASPDQFRSFFTDPNAFFSSKSFPYLFASLVLLFFGPGSASLDRMFRKKQSGGEPPSDKE